MTKIPITRQQLVELLRLSAELGTVGSAIELVDQWTAAADCEIARLRAEQVEHVAPDGWQPIETAPEGDSVILWCAHTIIPVYCGRYRYGNHGEPQQNEFAWRCDSSGRFASPTHWMPLPAAPKNKG